MIFGLLILGLIIKLNLKSKFNPIVKYKIYYILINKWNHGFNDIAYSHSKISIRINTKNTIYKYDFDSITLTINLSHMPDIKIKNIYKYLGLDLSGDRNLVLLDEFEFKINDLPNEINKKDIYSFNFNKKKLTVFNQDANINNNSHYEHFKILLKNPEKHIITLLVKGPSNSGKTFFIRNIYALINSNKKENELITYISSFYIEETVSRYSNFLVYIRDNVSPYDYCIFYIANGYDKTEELINKINTIKFRLNNKIIIIVENNYENKMNFNINFDMTVKMRNLTAIEIKKFAEYYYNSKLELNLPSNLELSPNSLSKLLLDNDSLSEFYKKII